MRRTMKSNGESTKQRTLRSKKSKKGTAVKNKEEETKLLEPLDLNKTEAPGENEGVRIDGNVGDQNLPTARASEAKEIMDRFAETSKVATGGLKKKQTLKKKGTKKNL